MVAEFPGRLEIGVIFRYRALLANLLHVMGCFASVIRLFFVSWNVRGSILECLGRGLKFRTVIFP